MKVSGDLLLKLAIAAGAAWGVYVMVGKASSVLSDVSGSISSAASAAMDSVTAVYDDSKSVVYNAEAEPETAFGKVVDAVVTGVPVLSVQRSVLTYGEQAYDYVSDWFSRVSTPNNTPYTGEVPNIEIRSWR